MTKDSLSDGAHQEIKLTSFSHGGGCGCKIAPGVLAEILKKSKRFPGAEGIDGRY